MDHRNLRRAGIAAGASALLLAAGALVAQQGGQPQTGAQPAHGAMADHIMITPDQIEWKDGPDSLPPGAKIAVLEGDLASGGPFTLRAKFPDGYRIAAHTHPGAEHVTVLSGTFHMGLGDKLDTAKGTALPAGGFAVMPAGTRHYAWTEGETVVQVHGTGPFGITYVDPTNDPRNKK